ncbi:hypothetical protein D1872_334940 [compost metagenome]
MPRVVCVSKAAVAGTKAYIGTSIRYCGTDEPAATRGRAGVPAAATGADAADAASTIGTTTEERKNQLFSEPAVTPPLNR